jgi:hypothetical protein
MGRSMTEAPINFRTLLLIQVGGKNVGYLPDVSMGSIPTQIACIIRGPADLHRVAQRAVVISRRNPFSPRKLSIL